MNPDKELSSLMKNMELKGPSSPIRSFKRKNPFDNQRAEGEPLSKVRFVTYFEEKDNRIDSLRKIENAPKSEAKISAINNIFSILDFRPSRMITKIPFRVNDNYEEESMDKRLYEFNGIYDSDHESCCQMQERYKKHRKKLFTYLYNYNFGPKTNKIIIQIDKMLSRNKKPYTLLPKHLLSLESTRKRLKYSHIDETKSNDNTGKCFANHEFVSDIAYGDSIDAARLWDKKIEKSLKKREKNNL